MAGRMLASGLVVLQSVGGLGAISMQGTAAGADPPATVTRGHQFNPFVGSPNNQPQPTGAGMPVRPSVELRPTAQAHLQIPRVQAVSSKSDTVFLGPAFDAFEPESFQGKFAASPQQPERLPSASELFDENRHSFGMAETELGPVVVAQANSGNGMLPTFEDVVEMSDKAFGSLDSLVMESELPTSEFTNNPYSDGQFSEGQTSEAQYSENQYSENQHSGSQYSENQYLGSQYAGLEDAGVEPYRMPASYEAGAVGTERESVVIFDEAMPDPTMQFDAPTAKLASAARKRSAFLQQQPPQPIAGASVYLATQTAKSQSAIAVKLLEQAQLEYDCAAYASAETSAWQALEKCAQSIDLSRSMSVSGSAPVEAAQTAIAKLHRGHRAIIEACDFVGPYAQDNRQAIARLARAHETPVVREALPPMRMSYSSSTPDAAALPSASEAVDRYLDYARMQLSDVASESLLAARAMDLLAAIRLGRNDAVRLPGPTAICLRRAAVQGQSGNADLVAKLGHHLADVGLVDEARWALQHSLSIQHNPANAARLATLNQVATRPTPANYGQSILAATRSRVRQQPDVITMSPEQFASISTQVMPGNDTDPNAAKTSPNYPADATGELRSTPVPDASGLWAGANPPPSQVETPEKPSFIKALAANFHLKPNSSASVPARTASFERTHSPTLLPRSMASGGMAGRSNIVDPNTMPTQTMTPRAIAPPTTASQAMNTRAMNAGVTGQSSYPTNMPNAGASGAPTPQKVSSRFLPSLKKWW